MGFAQHQSFYIRSNWLSKILVSLESEDFFSDPTNHMKLGLGKNMFNSLKYWATATGIAEKTKNNTLIITDFGKVIKDFDIDCLKKDTLSIIHYNLCKKNSPAEAWYWFFNIYSLKSGNRDDIYLRFLEWVSSTGRKVSEKSLKRDFDCLIQFYTASENVRDPEDMIYSPFSALNLVAEDSDNNHRVLKKPGGTINTIGAGALMYCLIDYQNEEKTHFISVDDFLNKEGLWGKIFNMKKPEIAEALNILSLDSKNKLSFIRTNSLDTIVCELTDPIDYLQSYYRKNGNQHESV